MLFSSFCLSNGDKQIAAAVRSDMNKRKFRSCGYFTKIRDER
jgi:hypothetical protein